MLDSLRFVSSQQPALPSASIVAPARTHAELPATALVGSWPIDSAAYRARRAAQTEPAPPYNGLGPWHAAIGGAIWERRTTLRGHCLHFLSKGVLLAVLDVRLRAVHLRKGLENAPFDAKRLQLEAQLRPETAANKPAPEFHTRPVYDLTWWHGLTDGEALRSAPSDLGQHLMRLRRFPPVNPQLVLARHLAIFQAFSSQPMTYEALFNASEESAQAELPGDLAALYITGCLEFVGQVEPPPSIG